MSVHGRLRSAFCASLASRRYQSLGSRSPSTSRVTSGTSSGASLPGRSHLEHRRSLVDLVEHGAVEHGVPGLQRAANLAPVESAAAPRDPIERRSRVHVVPGESREHDRHVVDAQTTGLDKVLADFLFVETIDPVLIAKAAHGPGADDVERAVDGCPFGSVRESRVSVRHRAGTPPSSVTRYRGSGLLRKNSMSSAACSGVGERSTKPKPQMASSGRPR